MNLAGLTSLMVIVALLTAVFFIFGLAEIKTYFCPEGVTTGICGFLGNLLQIINYLFSWNIFLVLALPVVVCLTALFFLFLDKHFSLPAFIRFDQPGLLFIVPKVRIREKRWLRNKINSPTLN